MQLIKTTYLALVSLGAASLLNAGITLNPAEFGSFASSYTQTFNTQPANAPIADPITFSGNGFSSTAVATTAAFWGVSNATQPWDGVAFSTSGPKDTINLHTFVGGVNAVSGYVFVTDTSTQVITGNVQLQVSYTNGSSNSQTIASQVGEMAWFGITAPESAQIESIAITTNTSGGYATLEDYTIGTLAVIPEPATAALALGALGLAVAFWRRRR